MKFFHAETKNVTYVLSNTQSWKRHIVKAVCMHSTQKSSFRNFIQPVHETILNS